MTGDRLHRTRVDLGHNLGMHVVAEGVEDAATRQELNRIWPTLPAEN